MHSVQVEVQYVYVAEALCEYGKAMGYWNKPELLRMFTKFKASFDEYVAKLAVAGQAPPQGALLGAELPPLAQPQNMPPSPLLGQPPGAGKSLPDEMQNPPKFGTAEAAVPAAEKQRFVQPVLAHSPGVGSVYIGAYR
ncbi:hypothetical protein ANCCAN_21506 [Ancylostoma caninum]|uniref:Uncharacterized protein n=1 Tax=Ancylostoma caninum TaxID=29170 RepID=A0A368FKL0_ANCCA|nr:hypothetical protein ANCCAN_21506 [Ancylostoma caninum]